MVVEVVVAVAVAVAVGCVTTDCYHGNARPKDRKVRSHGVQLLIAA